MSMPNRLSMSRRYVKNVRWGMGLPSLSEERSHRSESSARVMRPWALMVSMIQMYLLRLSERMVPGGIGLCKSSEKTRTGQMLVRVAQRGSVYGESARVCVVRVARAAASRQRSVWLGYRPGARMRREGVMRRKMLSGLLSQFLPTMSMSAFMSGTAGP